jgi:hypothetical protein
MSNYSLEQLRTDGLPHVMSYLIEAAREHSNIKYGTIALRLRQDLNINGNINHRDMGKIVGTLMEKILANYPSAPLINSLAVNKKTDYSSKGADSFIAQRYKKNIGDIQKSHELRSKLISRTLNEVYAFGDWDKIARKLFRRSVAKVKAQATLAGTEIDRSTTPGQPRGGLAESPEHEALKARIVKNPQLAGVAVGWLVALPEFPLRSGDEVDVCVLSPTGVHLVEVKSRRSNDVDFRRGIYQCVKYRAVYEAMRIELGSATTVYSVLVTESRLPPVLRALAKQNNIAVRVVRPLQASNGKSY